MKYLEKWISKLNSQQKIILAFVVPIGLFILFYRIANEFDNNIWRSEPFRFEETWWVWLLYVAIVGVFEYKLFEQRKND